MQWQPIETAPEEEDVLVHSVDYGDLPAWSRAFITVMHKEKDGSWWVSTGENIHNRTSFIFTEPTHWMPIPEKPVKMEKTDEGGDPMQHTGETQ